LVLPVRICGSPPSSIVVPLAVALGVIPLRTACGDDDGKWFKGAIEGERGGKLFVVVVGREYHKPHPPLRHGLQDKWETPSPSYGPQGKRGTP
jgi:hypothetical protein